MNPRGWRPGVASMLIAFVVHPAVAAEVLLVHGHIYTGAPGQTCAQAVAINGSHIEAVGKDQEILRRRTTKTQVIDLHGRTVIPGIVDSHIHLLLGAYALHGENLSSPQSSITPERADIIVERMKAYAAAHPDDTVIFGRADFSTVPPTTPTHQVLDRAVPDRPVVIYNAYGHAMWLNKAAMKMAGLTDQPLLDPEQERGVIRDASGTPTGTLLEAGMEIVNLAVEAHVPLEKKLTMIREATQYLNGYGITSVVNATGNLAEIKLYAALRDQGLLTVRTRTSFGSVAVQHHLTPTFIAELEEARQRYHDEWVAANLVKFFVDGGSGLLPPVLYRPEDYAALIMALDARGFQIMTHAVRADSVHMILDTYAKVEKTNGNRDRRLRIEHADLINADDLSRFSTLGVIVGMQATFCCGDVGSNYDAEHQIPSDRWKSLVKSGTTLAFSSDWPSSWPPNPFVAMQQATTRQVWHSPDTGTIAGLALDGAAQAGAVPSGGLSYVPDERISVRDAVRAYTQGSAYAAFEDTVVGTLEVGKLADLAILSQDIFAIPSDQIGNTKVMATMVGGKFVYNSPEEFRNGN